MNRGTTKLLLITLVVVMLAGVFAGCGSPAVTTPMTTTIDSASTAQAMTAPSKTPKPSEEAFLKLIQYLSDNGSSVKDINNKITNYLYESKIFDGSEKTEKKDSNSTAWYIKKYANFRFEPNIYGEIDSDTLLSYEWTCLFYKNDSIIADHNIQVTIYFDGVGDTFSYYWEYNVNLSSLATANIKNIDIATYSKNSVLPDITDYDAVANFKSVSNYTDVRAEVISALYEAMSDLSKVLSDECNMNISDLGFEAFE